MYRKKYIIKKKDCWYVYFKNHNLSVKKKINEKLALSIQQWSIITCMK